MGQNFESISCAEDLVVYLGNFGERLKNQQYVYSYMSLKKLILTVSSKRYYLSCPEKMNDEYEIEKYPNLRKPGVFYACFMKSEAESIAMWSMYAQPWECGVRIAIPVNEFKKWIKEIKHVYYEDKGNIVEVDKFNVYYGDVLYVDSNSDTVIRGSARNYKIKDFCNDERLSGYVKDIAWQYERECRLHIDVDDLCVNGVLIDIPQYVFDRIQIMTGPRCDANIVSAELMRVCDSSLKITSSKFSNLLRWVYCDDCTKKRRTLKRKYKRKSKKGTELPDINISELLDTQ